jgi:predicted  nucleic acid-binding Zn-ribbon protein
MIKRQDLVKQFELIVKQEIINHNNSILQTNRSVNLLTEKIESSNKFLDDRINRFDSKIGYIETQIKDIFSGHKKFVKEINSTINDLNTSLQSLYVSNKMICSSSDNKFLDKISFNNYKNKQILLQENIKKEISSIEQQISWLNKHFHDQLENSIRKIVELIKQKPAEIEKLSNEISNKIESFRVDNKSLIEEIVALKKKNFIQDKKIENLYNTFNKKGIA